LLGGEVEALWEIADDAERQLLGLLLCGLDEGEIAALSAADFDLEHGEVRVPGDQRRIGLPPLLLAELGRAATLPAWRSAAEARELGQRVGLLALDAGIAHAQEVTPAAIRHTYLVYLVRQGARLTELHRIAGTMDTASIRRYAPLSPAGASRPLGQLDLAYPLLA
jgi:integrase